MGSTRQPRSGSLQFRPKKRARKEAVRIRCWAKVKDARLLGFAGYKAGMTHVIANDNMPNSIMKGQQIAVPTTIIECPPIRVAGIVFYKTYDYGIRVSSQILSDKVDSELKRRISVPKKASKAASTEDFDELRLLVYTQPKMTGIGKKAPDLFEVSVGGSSNADKLKFAMEKLGKEIALREVFSEGSQVDVHAVSKGKGYSGPVKRSGISLKSHKSEKSRRRAIIGNEGEAKVGFGVHQDGQLGYHTRTEYNKWILKIGDTPSDVNPKGGFVRFGNLRNTYIIIKGSVPGPAKRLLRMNIAIRPDSSLPKEPYPIEYISLESRQKL